MIVGVAIVVMRIIMCIILLNPLYCPEVACAFTLCEDLVKGDENRKKAKQKKSKADSCLTLLERKRICLT